MSGSSNNSALHPYVWGVPEVRSIAVALLAWCDDERAERSVLGAILGRLSMDDPVTTPKHIDGQLPPSVMTLRG